VFWLCQVLDRADFVCAHMSANYDQVCLQSNTLSRFHSLHIVSVHSLKLLFYFVGFKWNDQGRNSPVQLFEILLNAVHLDSSTHSKVSNLLYSAPLQGKDIATQRRLLGELQIEAEGLLHRQKRVLAAVLIQKVIRAYRARKTYHAYLKIYVKERNTQVHDLISREVTYNRFIIQLSQRYVVPLLNTPDKQLKEESSDFGELLQALLKIERLHRCIGFFDFS
jgi:hypothetical protein